MAHGLFVETQNGKGLIIAILWQHKMFPQSGINMIYYPDCSLAPLAGHFYFIDFFEGSDRTWIFGLKSNDLESSWQQFQPSSDSVFHRGTRVHT